MWVWNGLKFVSYGLSFVSDGLRKMLYRLNRLVNLHTWVWYYHPSWKTFLLHLPLPSSTISFFGSHFHRKIFRKLVKFWKEKLFWKNVLNKDGCLVCSGSLPCFKTPVMLNREALLVTKQLKFKKIIFVLASFWLQFWNLSCVEKLYFMSFDVFCVFHMGLRFYWEIVTSAVFFPWGSFWTQVTCMLAHHLVVSCENLCIWKFLLNFWPDIVCISCKFLLENHWCEQ